MTMIEKVAQAIADNITAGLPEGVEIDTRYAALAAIEAMSDPTDAMKLAGGFKCEAIMFEDDPDGTGVIFNDMGHVYRVMIDAALKEGQ